MLYSFAFRSEGIDMWGLTTQNEPIDGNIEGFEFNCMGWNASDQRKWVAENLGPTLEGYRDNFVSNIIMIFNNFEKVVMATSN